MTSAKGKPPRTVLGCGPRNEIRRETHTTVPLCLDLLQFLVRVCFCLHKCQPRTEKRVRIIFQTNFLILRGSRLRGSGGDLHDMMDHVEIDLIH